ncbi:nickel resistance protein [Leptolyngbya sp. Heron Island J]|uniref:MFS transporter n=1 Tax=Leptolyngbya sp. Heron Island J TaxID=1385935 RepID=UPI0003B9DBE0|nr:MFS transporter [Leptolyngbya sp. Heron Island J]ESA35322.1 nickel resistance protein [Leptolyngbya sp. Heron Island J]
MWKQRPRWLQGLANPVFARLYLAQTVNLVGESFTWLGLALLAFELAGEQSGTILAGALTLRVLAFVVLAPIAGAIADQIDRKRLMIITHLVRMGIVCLLPFITQPWHIYGIVFLLNVFYAFFTPTYTATIPLVTTEEECPKAIALSSATYQLLGVLGPGLAGSIAALVGTRQVFFLDAITFLVAALLIATLPGQLRASDSTLADSRTDLNPVKTVIQNIKAGTGCLFTDPPMRYALMLQLVAAIAGAQILVNTVGYVQGTLQLGKLEYGWVMAAFGIGATLAAINLGNARKKNNPILLASGGAVLITLTLASANFVDWAGLLLLWALAGAGQTLINVPTQTLIASRVAKEAQGRVYGAQFAWSHFWWALAYPLAGWLGNYAPGYYFLYSSLIGGGLLIVVSLWFKPQRLTGLQPGLWHEHEHTHDEHHSHDHSTHRHSHFHFHDTITPGLRDSASV